LQYQESNSARRKGVQRGPVKLGRASGTQHQNMQRQGSSLDF
jgi:hypothetical protein